MGKESFFFDTNGQQKRWITPASFYFTLFFGAISGVLAYLALDQSTDIKYNNDKIELLKEQIIEMKEQTQAIHAEVDQLKEIVALMRGDSSTQKKHLIALEAEYAPNFVLQEFGFAPDQISIIFTNRGGEMNDLRVTSKEGLIFDLYGKDHVDAKGILQMEVKNFTPNEHHVNIEYTDQAQKRYLQTLTIHSKKNKVTLSKPH